MTSEDQLPYQETVRPEWIDYNGHMNVAYYLLVFDHASDALIDQLDLGIDYRNRENCSMFAVETHITYEREVLEGDGLAVNALSGGVDSSVVTMLGHRALGDRLKSKTKTKIAVRHKIKVRA